MRTLLDTAFESTIEINRLELLMNILVIYAQQTEIDRKTKRDHLYSFVRYVENHQYFYLNVIEADPIDVKVLRMPFDAVIFHTSFLVQRYQQAIWEQLYCKLKPKLAALSGYKVMLPQDDYNYTADLWRIASECNVDHIFSVMPENQLAVAYPPEKIGHATVSTVLTGYIDENSLSKIDAMHHECARSIDIGYRANALPYWFGYFGQIKMKLQTVFSEKLVQYPNMQTNIQNTVDTKNAFLGDDWTRFLLSCRCMLGCLGGSSILDPDGSIAKRVDAYCAVHPEAEYEEVHQACFPTEEDSIRGFAPSPRIFECAMTKTCQLLVEGDYYGIVQPGVDYIEIKQDFSNVDEVLELVRDHAYCERIAEQCYQHVIRPGDPDNPYTYRWFANHVVDYIEQHKSRAPKPEMTPRMRAYLEKRCAYLSSKRYLIRRASPRWYRPFVLFGKLFVYVWTSEGREKIVSGVRRRLFGAK